MKDQYNAISFLVSRMITRKYSTSFSMGIRLFRRQYREPIYAVYGFVRLADEIVASFHNYDKQLLLKRFKDDTFIALSEKVSLNPILHSFQMTVNNFQIDHDLIFRFLSSMEMDLEKKEYNQEQFNEYVLGSAQVVGLMCLKIFTHPNVTLYDKLKLQAMQLGSAYQKINFLRDLKADFKILGRSYFPGINLSQFNEANKLAIIANIQEDLGNSIPGIRQLSKKVRYGVLISFQYYNKLLLKIKQSPANQIMKKRIRISNGNKFWLFLKMMFRKGFSL